MRCPCQAAAHRHPTATPTRTPTATPPPGNTPTPTSTPTSQAADIVIDFNTAPNPGRTLNGQYPVGVADWGTNAWYLSRPWKSFTTNSISFNGVGRTSASVSFPIPRRLLSLDAFNGGGGSSTVTVACAGQPTRSLTLAPNQVATLTTSWGGTCSTVTITSSNGWDTNFDRLVVR